MTKAAFFSVGLVALFATVRAQDSLSVPMQTALYQRDYSLYTSHVVLQSRRDLADYGDLNAQFNSESGPYRLAQQASVSRQVLFATRGTRQLGAYRLSGEFSYKHQTLDSVGFTLRQGLPDPAPYYFFSWKKGNWQTGKYRLKALISRKLWADKLSVGVSVQNEALNAWRSNDPRPEQFNFQLGAEAGISYQVHRNHSIGVSGSLGTQKEDNSVDYRNTDYQLSLAYPEYVRRLQFGYGMEDRASNSDMKATGQLAGWKLYYMGNWGQHQIDIWGGYNRRETGFRSDSTRFFPTGRYGDFFEDHTELGLNWSYRRKHQVWALRAGYSYLLGRDYNHFLGANNYVYARESLHVQPLFQRLRKGKPLYEIELDWSLTDLFRADGNAGVETDYQYWEAHIAGTYYIHSGKTGTWTLLGSIGSRQAIDPQLEVPVQQSEFVKQVVMADYYYYRASTYTGSLGLRYSQPVKSVIGFVQLRASITRANYEDLSPTTDWRPGKNRFWAECAFGINLRP